jgi:hypothetical protein
LNDGEQNYQVTQGSMLPHKRHFWERDPAGSHAKTDPNDARFRAAKAEACVQHSRSPFIVR